MRLGRSGESPVALAVAPLAQRAGRPRGRVDHILPREPCSNRGGCTHLVPLMLSGLGVEGQARGAHQVVDAGSPVGGEHPLEDRHQVLRHHLVPRRVATSGGGASGFRVGGGPGRSGSMITARARTRAGSRHATSVTRSPFGSITTTPRPARMSARIWCTSTVDLPDPVAPMRCTWCRASATRTPTARPRRTPRAAAASSRPRPDHPSDVVAVVVSVLVVVSPRGFTSGPGQGTPGGGATDRAPARTSPGVCSAAGRAAIAASSPTESRSPRASRRSAIAWSGRSRRRRR